MSNTTRNIIVHYHLFKNAGTSVDHLLKKNFGDDWMGFDGETPGSIITSTQLEKTIIENPEKSAFSSHQIVPPLPKIDCNVYPIVFLRDPIDRIKSAFLFEWQKQAGLVAPKGSLKEFVEHKFTYKRKNSVEEFQTIRLSNHEYDYFHGSSMSDKEMFDCACKFVESLSFVGIVDEFDQSMKLLHSYLEPAFPEFSPAEIRANVLQDISMPMAEKRSMIKVELGEALYEEILDRNRMDESLYQFAKSHFRKLVNSQLKAA